MQTVPDQYLVFTLRDSLYAFDARVVNATFRLPEITPVEEQPHVAGVINLGGKIIPVLDLDLLFGRAPQRHSSDEAMVVIHVNGNIVGIVVNDVRDVIAIRPDQVEEVASAPAGRRVVSSRAKVREEIVMILDPESVIAFTARGSGAEFTGYPSDFNCALPCAPPQTEEAPDREQAVLHRRSLELMMAAEGEDPPGKEQVAVVSLGGEYFGFHLESVREFSTVTNLTPLPNCPDHVVGNMNLRGSILLVVDIRGVLQMPPGRLTRESKVVVASVGDIEVGIAVDDIIDIVRFSASDLSPLPASVHPAMERLALGPCLYEESAVTVLNLPEILKEERLAVGGAC
ncbi:chemotaxis protein CheW [Citrifermentans bremense]|uniref:chemotaxis protein CheW n=1 Tax=Citrifermentans bremense TaxID=60035 RepID=UPI0003F98754|nr:chemotaxis protein CheW [Citrifermentans bremense]